MDSTEFANTVQPGLKDPTIQPEFQDQLQSYMRPERIIVPSKTNYLINPIYKQNSLF